MAAWRRIERRWDLALERSEFLAPLVEAGHFGEQGLRVGVVRRGAELLGRRLLDDAAEIHDGDAGGERLAATETMTEEGTGKAECVARPDAYGGDLRWAGSSGARSRPR